MQSIIEMKVLLCRALVYSVVFLSSAHCSVNEKYDPSYFPPDFADLFDKRDTASLNFMIISDWGFNGSINQLKVASEMEEVARLVKMEFVLTSGDNFQGNGVKSAKDILWTKNFENVYSDSSLLIPWYPALGNHDYLGNPEAQVQYSSINSIWNMPDRYYTFVKKINPSNSVRFIVLDTPGLIEEFEKLRYMGSFDSIAQYRWFESVLSISQEQWIIVTGHHPIFSASSYHGGSEEMNKMIRPLLSKYGVDFYFCGHDHHFEHARENNSITDFIVTGTGGETRQTGFDFNSVFTLSRLGFTYISLYDDRAKLYFITSEGEIGYHFERLKSYEVASRICRK